MARIYQQSYWYPVPDHAEIITKKGEQFARFKARGGRTITAPLCGDGKHCLRKTRKWYGEFKDQDGVLQNVPLSTSKDEAEEKLRELKRKVEKRKRGLRDPYEEHLDRLLSEHLEEFRQALEADNNSPKHVTQQASRLRKIFDGCRFLLLQDLDAHRVATWLKAERESGRMRIATSNKYLQVLKHFGDWLIKERRWPENVFGHLDSLNEDLDDEAKRERRAASNEEMELLLEAARTSKETFRHLSGEDRRMLYYAAAFTGFRCQELASLTAAAFDLDSNVPTVTVAAKRSKRRKKDVQPISPEAAARLKDWIAERREADPDALLWPGSWWRVAAKMLRTDLKAAKAAWIEKAKSGPAAIARLKSDVLEYIDHEGRYFDFHALRVWYITTLARADIHPKEAQVLARHSKIDLTMNVYTKLRVHDVAGALSHLPELIKPDNRPEPQTLRATGTDDQSADPPTRKLTGKLTGAGVLACADMSGQGENADPKPIKSKSPKPLKVKGLSDKRPVEEPVASERRRPDLNRGWRICNPQLEAENPLENEGSGDLLTGKLTGPAEIQDPALARLIDVWPTLPDAIKAGISAMIEAAQNRPEATTAPAGEVLALTADARQRAAQDAEPSIPRKPR